MNILISNASPYPIYEQIYRQIKEMILNGKLKEHDALPSMRVLAKELRISVITTKRAYDELEREGFIVSVTGKGSFVAGANLEFVREEHLRQMEHHLKKAMEHARMADLKKADLVEMLDYMEDEE